MRTSRFPASWACDSPRCIRIRWASRSTTCPTSRISTHDLYPDSVPWVAFLRVLDAPRDGAEGMLHQQITPYSYVGQEVWANSSKQISVPAGSFSALKLTAQIDIATVIDRK